MIDAADISHGRILIVDDQQANIILLEQMLRGAGYDSVSATTDGGEVCKLHLVNRYDLILLDLQMPGMDGFQVLENLKEIETGGYLPVLVITAQPDHKLRALRAGARDFVSKPFDLAEVLLRVHHLLEVRLLHLQALELNQRLVAERQVSARLLGAALPRSIMERLQQAPRPAADGSPGIVTGSFAEVAVLFADLLEFTAFSEGAGAKALVGVLDELSTQGDVLGAAPGRDRTTAMGEAYLAVVGLPEAVAERTLRASRSALDLVEAVARFNRHSRYKLQLRIGLDTAAGVSGAVAQAGRAPKRPASRSTSS
jgi:adenylate cyclase